ncbi:MAG: hypothetical protein A2092_10165 [Rhodobacteraceae bacterium GWE1_64_9]|nr:MAG: hypothetical protein A2092_10165 [Rhodobacteraceae bacterium GWE1_64_9]OHC47319.1 MAG: hypothetical protein A2X69_02870 [Rhodobacteraceae bacterium GWF1_65_7]HBD92007.1 DUF262 domain-containing protein [Gemmobacter sp.]HBU15466.1 DUF262 domain-containing protein [Gemmobacter sp.]
MSRFEINSLQRSSAWSLYRMREKIKMNPVYQRQGDIWSKSKRQLLIDTMINGFDVPKLYLHKFQTPLEEGGETFEYAMIDGKQRAEAIFDFIENSYSLDSNFQYMADEDVDLSGFTYRELAKEYPEIKQDFDSFTLDVITIDTDDIELIEDLFSRLNEAMPLNAAEKRNAKPGPLPALVRQIAEHKFFKEKIPFGNSRYRHYDIAAKMLLMVSRETIGDTKKAQLDRFFVSHRDSTADDVSGLLEEVKSVLDKMVEVFTDSDGLLRSVGMISLYFLLFRRAIDKEKTDLISRIEFADFEVLRQENRSLAEEEDAGTNFQLLEFDRFAQSPNDAIALRFRLAVVDEELYNGAMGFAGDTVLGEK